MPSLSPAAEREPSLSAPPPALRPPLLWEPRAATIPAIIILLVCVLLTESVVMTHVSSATPREESFEASKYTVDYRDCWVIERMSEALPALSMAHLQNSVPAEYRDYWGDGSSRVRSFQPMATVPKTFRGTFEGRDLTSKLERLRTKLGSAAAEPELYALAERLRAGVAASPDGQAALEALLGDLAAAKGAEFAAKSSLLLGRVADPLHDWVTGCIHR